MRRLAAVAVVSLACAFGTWIRIDTAFSQPGFDLERPERMLKSDPGLLYYFAERIVESGGLPPDDFRADPRVEHPWRTDVPALFTVGQEFLVAWAYLAYIAAGGEAALHVVATVVMAGLASLCAIGLFGLARELTGSVPWASFATLLYVVTPANYRTIAFILVREDLSLPLLALHAWLLARAVRLRTGSSAALAALALLGAVATWHAMAFVVALEAACVFAWFLRTGQNPLASRYAWVFPGVLLLGSIAVPVLRAKLFALSLPMLALYALGVEAALTRGRSPSRSVRALVGTAALAGGVALALGASHALGARAGDYGHVFELLVAKLRFLGELPDDPDLVPFGARLLWQGPFATSSFGSQLSKLLALLLVLPVAVVAALPAWWRGRGDACVAVAAAFAALALAASSLADRMMVLPGLVAPALAALLLRDLPRQAARAWATGLALVQAVGFGFAIRDYSTDTWYPLPYLAGIEETVRWVHDELPDRACIAADFVNSTALLAHTDHAIALQPKYETARTRDRIERFSRTFYHEPPAALRRMLEDELECRYLLVDVGMLWSWRYHAGLPWSATQPPREGAAFLFLNGDPRGYRNVPGFELLFESEAGPSNWRLYRVGPAPPPE